jgi:hypothetical protein
LWSRVCRQIAGTLVVVLIVLFSVGATYGARAYRSELSRSLEATAGGAIPCAEVAMQYNISTTTLTGGSVALLDRLNVVAASGTPEELQCVCSFLSFRLAVEALFDSQHPCNAYFLGKLVMITLTCVCVCV